MTNGISNKFCHIPQPEALHRFQAMRLNGFDAHAQNFSNFRVPAPLSNLLNDLALPRAETA